MTSATQDSAATGLASLLGIIPEYSFTYLTVFILTALWIVAVSIFLGILARKYTFGNWTEENPNPYKLETLGMPRGTMRGILTVSLLFVVILLEVVNLRMEGLEGKIDNLLVAFQMMLAFYFGSKVMHHLTKADERKSETLSRAMTEVAVEKEGLKQGEFDQEGAAG